jgi:hypothetical protein
MKKVFRKPAVPLAMQLTREFIKINLDPVTRLEIPENSFLKNKAMVTDEPTAAVYPYAKSFIVYVLDAFLFP